jgi:L-ascorbate metabolism protein UlaG (beta-lactamase superfamily)
LRWIVYMGITMKSISGISGCTFSSAVVILGLTLTLFWLTSASGAEVKPLVADTVPTQDGDLKIYPINHATLALQWKGKTIYVDPVGGAKAFEGLPAPDLILVCHIHGDHFDKATLSAVAGKAVFAAPATVAEQMPADLRPRTTVLTNGQRAEIAGIPVEAIPAYNTTQARLNNHPKGRDNGYVLTLGGKRIYISGDTEDIPEMLALKNIDVAFLCMNLPYTMDVTQAAKAVRAFKPRIVYPYHSRGSDLEEFKKQVGTDAGVEVRVRDWYAPRG